MDEAVSIRFLCEQRKKPDPRSYTTDSQVFQSASFANKGRNSGSKAPQKCIRKRLIAFSRHNNCESVCAILNKR